MKNGNDTAAAFDLVPHLVRPLYSIRVVLYVLAIFCVVTSCIETFFTVTDDPVSRAVFLFQGAGGVALGILIWVAVRAIEKAYDSAEPDDVRSFFVRMRWIVLFLCMYYGVGLLLAALVYARYPGP